MLGPRCLDIQQYALDLLCPPPSTVLFIIASSQCAAASMRLGPLAPATVLAARLDGRVRTQALHCPCHTYIDVGDLPHPESALPPGSGLRILCCTVSGQPDCIHRVTRQPLHVAGCAAGKSHHGRDAASKAWLTGVVCVPRCAACYSTSTASRWCGQARNTCLCKPIKPLREHRVMFAPVLT